MARRYATYNVSFRPRSTNTLTHGLAATPQEWALGSRTSEHFLIFASRNSTVLAIRSSMRTRTGNTAQRGDVFAWVNHSIVK